MTRLALLGAAIVLVACGEPPQRDAPPSDAATTAAVTAEASFTPEASPTSERSPAPDTLAPAQPAVTPTPTSAGIDVAHGEVLTLADLASREPGASPPGAFLATRLFIQRIGIDATIEVRPGYANGGISTGSLLDIAYGAVFPPASGLGGLPGIGGNVVIAGYVGGANGLFDRLGELQEGDIIELHLSDGRRIGYKVAFNKIASPDIFVEAIRATAQESITLISTVDAARIPAPYTHRVVWGQACGTCAPLVQ